ncbi:MAG: N-acetylglucosamine-6-phosphate deacetylase [Akkermansiaceae bacterium]|nr:N-acetylglucosamine-6-phosphate deacetylase [Akkermansiaceae bacterium]
MPSLIANVKLVTPDEPIRPVSIECADDGRIAAIHEAGATPSGIEVSLDGGGELLAFAGFIDIHTHGANGVDLSQARDETVHVFAEAKLKEGVTTFLPTTWTESPEALQAMARSAAAYRAAGEPFARTPFLHVEGPYLNPKQAGAQNPARMRAPDLAEVRALAELCPIGLISLAVELDGAPDFIRAMRAMGVQCSAAHSNATYAEFKIAREAGLGHLTHYCNQMSPLHHRNVGLVGAGLLDDGVMIEVITDTIHLCPDMIELVFKHRSCDQLMIITDSIAAAHLGDGEYPLGDTTITVKDGAARIPAGNLAGSILQFHHGLKNVADITGLPLNEIAKTTAFNQARSLGLTDRGAIQQGMLADLTLLSRDFAVEAVFVGGERRV